MGLDNPVHIAFLLVVLLLVFGAKRLPEMGRSLGSGLREFKDSIGGAKSHEDADRQIPSPSPVVTPPAPDSAPPAPPPAATPAPPAAASPAPAPPAGEHEPAKG